MEGFLPDFALLLKQTFSSFHSDSPGCKLSNTFIVNPMSFFFLCILTCRRSYRSLIVYICIYKCVCTIYIFLLSEYNIKKGIKNAIRQAGAIYGLWLLMEPTSATLPRQAKVVCWLHDSWKALGWLCLL